MESIHHMSADSCGQGVEKHRLIAALRKSYLANRRECRESCLKPLFSCGSQASAESSSGRPLSWSECGVRT